MDVKMIMKKWLTINSDKKKTKTMRKRFLITINVLGSCGPIRLVVNEDENAGAVIHAALKLYGRQGRLPLLGSDVNAFTLYPAAFPQYDHGLKLWEAIGCRGERNFVLCKMEDKTETGERRCEVINKKGSGRWRAWLHKSLSLNIHFCH